MTVSSITPVNNYAGNGSNKIFDFDFPIEDKSELVVTHITSDGTRTVLTCDLDYTIEVVTDDDDNFVSYGTSITFPISSSSYSILDEDEKISLALSLSIEQQKEMKNSNKLNLSTLEWCLDYLTRLIQILNRKTERAIKVQEGSNISTDTLAMNLNKVADNSSIISSVANNLTLITSVNNNSQNINLVAGDLTSINAVASDLTNINNASGYANLAKDWATKTDGTVDGSEYSAKYYAQQASQGQIQADWNQADDTKKDYIKNKPTKLSDFTDDLGASPTHTHSQYLTSHQNLNGKADVDLTNATPTSAFGTALNTAGIRTVVETYVNGTSWYRVYSDKWCEQGGQVNVTTTPAEVQLLKQMADTNYSVFVSSVETNAGYGASAGNLTVSSFKIRANSNDSRKLTAWLVVGYTN